MERSEFFKEEIDIGSDVRSGTEDFTEEPKFEFAEMKSSTYENEKQTLIFGFTELYEQLIDYETASTDNYEEPILTLDFDSDETGIKDFKEQANRNESNTFLTTINEFEELIAQEQLTTTSAPSLELSEFETSTTSKEFPSWRHQTITTDDEGSLNLKSKTGDNGGPGDNQALLQQQNGSQETGKNNSD